MDQYKSCPQCGRVAALDAPLCLACGHRYRTQFQQVVPDQTQAFTPFAGAAPPNFPSTPPPPPHQPGPVYSPPAYAPAAAYSRRTWWQRFWPVIVVVGVMFSCFGLLVAQRVYERMNPEQPAPEHPAVVAARQKIAPGMPMEAVEQILGVRGYRGLSRGGWIRPQPVDSPVVNPYVIDSDTGRPSATYMYEVAPNEWLVLFYFMDDRTVMPLGLK